MELVFLIVIFLLCLGTVLFNTPFGFYRVTLRRFSWQWFMAIHLPVPFIIIARIASGAGWTIIPVLVACALAGQLLGGFLGNIRIQQQTVKENVREDEH